MTTTFKEYFVYRENLMLLEAVADSFMSRLKNYVSTATGHAAQLGAKAFKIIGDAGFGTAKAIGTLAANAMPQDALSNLTAYTFPATVAATGAMGAAGLVGLLARLPQHALKALGDFLGVYASETDNQEAEQDLEAVKQAWAKVKKIPSSVGSGIKTAGRAFTGDELRKAWQGEPGIWHGGGGGTGTPQ